ncbi:MAG: glutamate--tRNA ligase [Fibrobacteres bacterium]|jgi:glutamyl-tRNA synthetase|nr:glutamate--tRNA ligase [Fibrobacterota bacterium]
MTVRVRFAPSPTGYLHVGGARSALFNWLFARKMGGKFLLRIEDTDQSRYNETALHDLIRDLKWLGLNWDEGPEVGGPHEPYYQSQRLDLYKRHADELIAKGSAYRCFCTSERLDALRARQEENKMPPGYDRHCRDVDPEESNRRAAAGEVHVVRLRTPMSGKTVFTDLIRGEIEYQNHVLDDLVLLKTDGFPTYHLANVVDDHDMQITHVLRGDEWIPSTPRHVLLYQAFGWTPPVFCHLPVILAPGGGKLSKRKGAASVGDFRDKGYLPHALFNFLALLGWSPGDDREKMTLQELVESFSLERIMPKSAAFDEIKLEWLNGQYLIDTPVDSLLDEVRRILELRGYAAELAAQPSMLRKHVSLLKDRSKRIDEIVDTGLYFWRDPDTYDEKAVAKYWKAETPERMRVLCAQLQTVTWDHASLEACYRALTETLGIKFADLIHPTRLAVSGLSYGPGLFELLEALDRKMVIDRIHRALERLGG